MLLALPRTAVPAVALVVAESAVDAVPVTVKALAVLSNVKPELPASPPPSLNWTSVLLPAAVAPEALPLAICRQREAVESYIRVAVSLAARVRSAVSAKRFAAVPVAPSSFFRTIGFVPTFTRVMMRPSTPPCRLVMLREASEVRRSTDAVSMPKVQ